VATGGKNRDARAARERVRLYQARQELHDARALRRRRDNVVASVVGGILILVIVGGQLAFYTLGPGVPKPSPSPSATVGSPSPSATP